MVCTEIGDVYRRDRVATAGSERESSVAVRNPRLGASLSLYVGRVERVPAPQRRPESEAAADLDSRVFVAYVILSIGLPRLGVRFPIIYKDADIFWVLMLVCSTAWALIFGTLARLFTLLVRAPRGP